MYNGYSENDRNSNDNGVSGNYLNSGYRRSGYPRNRALYAADASSCRSWMVTSLIMHIAAFPIQILGLPALVITIVAMLKVKSFMTMTRMSKELSRVFLALCIYVGLHGFYFIVGFVYGFRMARKIMEKGMGMDPVELGRVIVDDLSHSVGTGVMMVAALVNIFVILYLLYVWIVTHSALKKF